ncbi:MAG: phosphatidate cytidylyltransferase [Planctomycetota bacterium]|nr:phosphatidate cytidylyltransferase [Planctomycetota bacterium]
MLKRIFYGSIMIGVLAGLFWLDWNLGERAHSRSCQWPLAVVLVALTAVAFGEVRRFLAKVDVPVLTVSGLIGAEVLATLPFWMQFLPGAGLAATDLLAVGGLIVAAAFLEQMARYRVGEALRRLAGTALAVAYLGVGGAMIVSLRGFGVGALVMFLAAVKAADTGAYFVGSAIGKHKIIPWLSPGKSWEGLVGGIGGSIGVTFLVAWAAGIELAWWQAVAFGAAMTVIGQFGDLCESLMKRSAGVKDSGALLPNFGGLLDLLDSPLIAAAPAYLMLRAWGVN